MFLKLRPVDWNDASLLWEWANETEVRRMAFHSDPITWESHTEWLAKKLADDNCLMLVGADETGTPVGQVRFDVDPSRGEAVVDVTISPLRRGMGLGCQMIRDALDIVWRDSRVVRICAFVKSENAGSARAFEKAGFKRGPDSSMSGTSTRTYSLERV
jgi:RimJ/RimL family protein N-acetyltransferase